MPSRSNFINIVQFECSSICAELRLNCDCRNLKAQLEASLEEEERVLRASHQQSLAQLRDKLRKDLEAKEQQAKLVIECVHCF